MSDASWRIRQGNSRLSRRAGLKAGAVGLGAAGAWLAACGGGGGDEDSGAAQSGSGASATQAAATQPRRGGTLTYRIIGTPPLDPHANPTFRAQHQAGFTYSRLLRFKTGPDPSIAFNYEIEPDLAQSVEMLDGGQRIVFKLRPDATFYNTPPVNGRAVTSEDVTFSIERFRTEPKNTNRNAFGTEKRQIVTSVETPDPQTFVVKLARPYAPIQNLFANPQYLWIMPKEAGSGFDPAKQQIGSGPWTIQSLQPDIMVQMVRNPKWFGAAGPYLDGVNAVMIPEVAQEIAQFQGEQLDLAGVPAERRSEVERTNPNAGWITYLPTTYTFIAPQLRDGSPFRDERVRRALSMAVDREAWLDLLYMGQGSHFLNAVPASMGKWWLDPQSAEAGDAARWFKFNPDESRKLLQAAGFEGQQFRYIYANNAYGEIFNQGAEATAGMLNQAGFNAAINVQDYLREYINASGTFFGNYDGVFYGLQTPFTDPHDYLFNMLHSGSARNHVGVNDAQLEAMIDAEERTLSIEERVKKVHDIQRYAMDKLYYVPMGVGNAYIAMQPWVKNYQYSATYGYATENYPTVWIER